MALTEKQDKVLDRVEKQIDSIVGSTKSQREVLVILYSCVNALARTMRGLEVY